MQTSKDFSIPFEHNGVEHEIEGTATAELDEFHFWDDAYGVRKKFTDYSLNENSIHVELDDPPDNIDGDNLISLIWDDIINVLND